MTRRIGLAPAAIPLGLLMWAWISLGRPAGHDGLYTVLGLSAVGAVLMPGIVISVDVHEGQAVKKGQILFRVDPRQF